MSVKHGMPKAYLRSYNEFLESKNLINTIQKVTKRIGNFG